MPLAVCVTCWWLLYKCHAACAVPLPIQLSTTFVTLLAMSSLQQTERLWMHLAGYGAGCGLMQLASLHVRSASPADCKCMLMLLDQRLLCCYASIIGHDCQVGARVPLPHSVPANPVVCVPPMLLLLIPQVHLPRCWRSSPRLSSLSQGFPKPWCVSSKAVVLQL